MSSRTEKAILSAYYHYKSNAKQGNSDYWGGAAENLWDAYQELQAYHKLKKFMFPINDEEAENE